MTEKFKNRVVLITGGGRGIGAGTARLFAAEGAKVVVASRSEAELKAVIQEIESAGGQALAVVTDVSEENAVKKLFAAARSKFGPVDILVNNAAVFVGGDFVTTTVETWDQIMAVNLRGTFLCAREFFAQGRSGAIVNISSLGGLRGTEKFKGFTPYSVSKFGIVGMTECLAVEGRELGIRVNCVAPGAVDTIMLKKAAPFLKTKTTPNDIAKIILFLSDESESKAVSGTVVEVFSNS